MPIGSEHPLYLVVFVHGGKRHARVHFDAPPIACLRCVDELNFHAALHQPGQKGRDRIDALILLTRKGLAGLVGGPVIEEFHKLKI